MYAKCRSEMYVELCPEAYEEDGDKKCCWRLEKAMYSTRSAAQDWQHEIKRRIKYTHIGEAEHLGKHMRVLNRIVRIHP